jgi:hypothetical protein
LIARRASFAWLAYVVILLGAPWLGSPANAASDPYLDWWTIETAHFRIHYYKGLEPAAERLADLAEAVNARLSLSLGWQMSEPTEVVLSDVTDDANGSATALPYNTIRLFMTAPDDLSPLGDYDDWYLELITHEHTHIMHTDNITGVPALFNTIMGKWWAPNQAQPRWLLEGLAVLEESVHTGGGRNRSSVFDMYLRADVLENRLAGLDQMCHFVRRWPQGNIWYLYGSRFLTWIADLYGEESMRFVAQDYGRQVVPWGINRSIRRATGKTYEELYQGWKGYLDDHYREQVRQAEALGIREGARLTHHGEVLSSPRFVPALAKKTNAPAELLYFRSDGHSPSGFYRLPLGDGRVGGNEQLAIRSQGQGVASFAADGRVIFNSVAITRRVYSFNDLFFLPSGIDAPSGYEPERKRMTEGARAQEPDVSPDGSEVVFTENHRGTKTLMIASVSDEGRLSDARALVPSARFEQAYTPRFSADGKWVVYSSWTAGGYRDIRVVDVSTGQFSEIAHDRAMDWEPSFSPDGKYVFFSSDRVLGIPNIFAFERSTGKLRQVTNVRTGAFHPEISPDGLTLVYVGYTSFGHDLYSMKLDEAEWLEPAPYVDVRPDPPPAGQGAIQARHRYNPLPTLRPRSWNVDYSSPGTFFGSSYTLTTAGGDVVGHHALAASMVIDTERSDPQLAVSYGYGRLPFDFGMAFFRQAGLVQNAPGRPVFVQQQIGVSSGVSYSLPAEFDSNSFSLRYSIYRFDGPLPLQRSADPDDPIQSDPVRGQIGSLTLGWNFTNAQSYLHSIGAERGFSLSLYLTAAVPPLASDFTLYTFGYSASDYIPLPWARHHTLALHASAAIQTGNYPYRGAFANGGFGESPLARTLTLGTYQSPFVLRGYPVAAFVGAQYHLYNAEYRFPIMNVDRGFSTLPLFFQRISGTFFADYGGAFYDLDPHDWTDQFHLGVGAEIWIECTLGYFLNPIIRVGHARGIADAAAIPGGQTYTVISVPF